MPEPGLTEREGAALSALSGDKILALAQTLVRSPGQNPPGEEAATVASLATACADRGLDVTTDEAGPGRSNLSARLAGGEAPGLLLLGHTDVVPVGDGWTVDPFGGEVQDGRLYGRGAADMKGGLAACVAAMSAVREAGVPLRGPVELAAVVDEEETGVGIAHYLTADRSGFAGCIVAEPTDLQTVIAARGDCYLRVAVTGSAAHAGNPADGRSAIYGAAEVVSDLERWHRELAASAHPLVGPPTWNVGTVSGGTATAIVPAECVVYADRRLLPDETGDQALAATADRIRGLGLADRGLSFDVSLTMEMPGFETPPDHPLVAAVDRALADAGGPALPLGGWTAACDGGFVARDAGVPVVVLGPGSVSSQAHRADESVPVADLLTAARTYTLAILRLLG